MPTPTHTLIADYTVTSNTTSISFTSISSSYRDLVLIAIPTSSTTPDCFIRFNNDSGSVYNRIAMYGNSSSSGASYQSAQNKMQIANLSYPSPGLDTNWVINIMDYSQTNKHKPVLIRANKGGSGVDFTVGNYLSTSAISSIEIGTYTTAVLTPNSYFALYGIVA